jgi:hypothetical protein
MEMPRIRGLRGGNKEVICLREWGWGESDKIVGHLGLDMKYSRRVKSFLILKCTKSSLMDLGATYLIKTHWGNSSASKVWCPSSEKTKRRAQLWAITTEIRIQAVVPTVVWPSPVFPALRRFKNRKINIWGRSTKLWWTRKCKTSSFLMKKLRWGSEQVQNIITMIIKVLSTRVLALEGG